MWYFYLLNIGQSAVHCKDTIPKIIKQIFPEKELRGLSPNFRIHVSVSDLYTYSHDWSVYSAAGKYVG
jgi:hypothetical protein